MKIGIMTTWAARCGIATYSAFLGEELINLGHEVTILAERKDVLPKGVDPNFPSKVPSIECWSRNESFTEAKKVIKKEKFDIVNIQHQFALFPNISELNGLAKTVKDTGGCLYTTLHDVIPYSPGAEEYFRILISLSDKIIVHTETCKQLLMRAWNCPESKIKLVLHGTKLISVPTKAEARKKLKIPKDAKVLLSYGFLWPSKGIKEIVEVLVQLKEKYPEAMYIHAGGQHPVFPYPDYIKSIIKTAITSGLRPTDMKITGFISDEQLVQYFGACDVIILNYARGSASASGAAHRSLSAHRPIIGSDDQCIEEIPKLEFAKFDKQGLLRTLKKLLENKKLQDELVKKAEKVAEETSWANTARKFIA